MVVVGALNWLVPPPPHKEGLGSWWEGRRA